MSYLKKLWNDYGIGGIFISIIVLYGLYMLYNHLSMKGRFGSESMTQERVSAYSNQPSSAIPKPSYEQNTQSYSSIDHQQTITPMDTAQNPSDLLPKDSNSQWAQLNPVGKGDLANINILKAGHHIGIDTIGQTLRNPNLQLRSEIPNPIVNTGPWNQSTIEQDFMRVPFEIGQGGQ